MTPTREWFDTLKPGDKVIKLDWHSNTRPTVQTVESRTKTAVRVDGESFSRGRYESRSCNQIAPYDPAVLAEWDARVERERVAGEARRQVEEYRGRIRQLSRFFEGAADWLTGDQLARVAALAGEVAKVLVERPEGGE